MDPDQTLAEIKKIFHNTSNDPFQVAYNFGKLEALFDGLDGWLAMGGYLPKEWGNVRER